MFSVSKEENHIVFFAEFSYMTARHSSYWALIPGSETPRNNHSYIVKNGISQSFHACIAQYFRFNWKNYFDWPKYSVADLGYRNEQNHHEILIAHKRIPFITYNQYHKEKKRKFQTAPYQPVNWKYDEQQIRLSIQLIVK